MTASQVTASQVTASQVTASQVTASQVIEKKSKKMIFFGFFLALGADGCGWVRMGAIVALGRSEGYRNAVAFMVGNGAFV